MTTESTVRYEVAGKVALITIDRPHVRNAIDQETADALGSAWRRFAAGPELAAVLTGAGDAAFSAGADLRDPPTASWRGVPWVGVDLEKPVVAAVGGWCIGLGLVLAVSADIIVASADARFMYPEAKVGRVGGMLTGLVGRIPHKVAMEILLLGEPIDARRAYEVGLVNRVVEPGTQAEVAIGLATAIADRAPLVVRYLKRETDLAIVRGAAERIQRDARLENERIHEIRSSHDAEEGRQAARARRPPAFRGD